MSNTNRLATDTGYRDETGAGKVTHFRLGASIMCRTQGDNRQASPRPRDVNCLKCLAMLAKVKR